MTAQDNAYKATGTSPHLDWDFIAYSGDKKTWTPTLGFVTSPILACSARLTSQLRVSYSGSLVRLSRHLHRYHKAPVTGRWWTALSLFVLSS